MYFSSSAGSTLGSFLSMTAKASVNYSGVTSKVSKFDPVTPTLSKISDWLY